MAGTSVSCCAGPAAGLLAVPGGIAGAHGGGGGGGGWGLAA